MRSLLLLWLLCVAGSAQSPITMTKMVVRLESPDVPQNSFAARPKTIYRAGNRYCRVEEAPDPEHRIHGLVIINEPDIWLVNLFDKTAQHQVDPGPTFNCRLPIFASNQDFKTPSPLKTPVAELEFGKELAFFSKSGGAPHAGPKLQGKITTAYVVDGGSSQLLLFTSGTPERPVAVVRQHGTRRDIYWYGVYDEVEFDRALFAEPKSVKIQNVK